MTGEQDPREDREGDQEPTLDPTDRVAFRGTPGATGEDGVKPDWPQDAGAYIGHEPERATETIPGGLGPDDERVAAHSTQGTGVGRPDERGQLPEEPTGHREADGTPGEPA